MYKRQHWFYPVFTLVFLISVFWGTIQPVAYAAGSQPTASYEDKEFNVDEGAADIQVNAAPSIFGLLLRLVISVAVIGGLTFVTMKFLRKNLHPQSSGEFISIFDQYALGVNKGIYVVEIADQVLVLGVTDQNVNVLSTIKDNEVIEEMRTRMLLRQNSMVPANNIGSYLGQKFGSKKQVEFKAHIQEQIQKLQSINVNVKKPGKDDEGV